DRDVPAPRVWLGSCSWRDVGSEIGPPPHRRPLEVDTHLVGADGPQEPKSRIETPAEARRREVQLVSDVDDHVTAEPGGHPEQGSGACHPEGGALVTDQRQDVEDRSVRTEGNESDAGRERTDGSTHGERRLADGVGPERSGQLEDDVPERPE